ncbi:MAG: hypothetical protein FWH04_06740 [Oscillospiraceae bacterium]|nr:hypothetical protein [Oscillospiraceae bacterium]
MGMTNEQFASFRRAEKQEFEDLLEKAEKQEFEEIIKKLRQMIDRAAKDTEK